MKEEIPHVKISELKSILEKQQETIHALSLKINQEPFSSTSQKPSADKQSNENCVIDSYLRICVARLRKGGERFVTLRIRYENLTESKIPINYSYGYSADLVDDIGNNSKIHQGNLPDFILPPQGNKEIGLKFEFTKAKNLADQFDLTIKHRTNPPGPISIIGIKSY